ncbi:MAG: hypothetical protein H0X58_05125, partial [Acidimicrobiia bacterium]|nr:hypothetical protein [Acidimicrobiia bacterium]
WHINADEALFQDYNTEFNPDGFYQADAFRSSDHDPVLVGLAARPGTAPKPVKGPKPVEVQLLALTDFHGNLTAASA